MAKDGIRILIVDDEEDFSEVLENYVRSYGYLPVVVHEPKEALRLLMNEPFDVIVIDSVMPEYSGLTLVEKLRAQGIMQPAIFCSGYPPEWIGGSIHNLNIVAFLEKQSLDANQLKFAIDRALEKSKAS